MFQHISEQDNDEVIEIRDEEEDNLDDYKILGDEEAGDKIINGNEIS